MSADLQDFKDIIEELKSLISEPDFDAQFKEATADVPKAKQFLIKMELKRLAQPCSRQIDLRGSVQGDPFPFDYAGQLHHLDELAKQIFEQQVEKFGRYTIGVFEAVMEAENNNRVLHKKDQEQRLAEKNRQQSLTPSNNPVKQEATKEKTISEFGAHRVTFTQYGIRHEERMNYSVNVELQFGIGKVLKASTSDLSISGAKVKIPAAKEVVIGQKVALYLTGLEEEYQLGLKDGIQYEIVGIESADASANYIRMKRTFLEDVNSFDDFLESFINSNKRKYKVNLENTLDAIIIKGFEQYYLPRINTLPVFIRQIKGRHLPTMALATENNRVTLGYFSDENNNLILQQILNEKRLEHIRHLDKAVKETTLFCFTHAKGGKLFFYSATTEELAQDENLKQLFLGFGAGKASWQIFKIQLVNADEKDAYIPLSVPDSASAEIKKLNQPPTPKVRGMVKDLQYVVLLTPLDGKQVQAHYQNTYQFDKSQVHALKQFGHPKLKRYLSINIETIDYVNLRSEDRYLYKSKVEIAKSSESSDVEHINGTTRDFSTNGLQVVLDQPGNFSKGDILSLSLPELQRITQVHKLKELRYELMAISKSKTVMNLRAYDQNDNHAAKPFFKKLIEQNIDKLTPAKMESRFPGLSGCLRNLTAKAINHMPVYFSKESSRVKVKTIGSSPQANVLVSLLQKFKPNNADVTLYPLLKNNAIHSNFTPTLNKLKRTDRPVHLDLYVRYRFNQEFEDRAFISQFDSQFNSEAARKSFIESSVENDCLLVYRIYLSRTGRPDMDFIAKELNYVGHYAIHRAKELEEKLWSVVGVGDVVDITEEVFVRYNISSELMKKQRVKKNRIML
jgi:hypothetical protein